MKTICTILLFIISFNSFSQSDTIFITKDNSAFDDTLIYATDTIILEDAAFGTVVLTGTTVLPETSNSINARGHGFFLTEVEGSPCKNNGHERVYRKDTKVASVFKTDSTWTCELSIVANCCHDFLCEISIKNDSILNFIYHGYGATYCACDCCFGLVYEITLDDYAKDDIAKVTHTMINGKQGTLRKIE